MLSFRILRVVFSPEKATQGQLGVTVYMESLCGNLLKRYMPKVIYVPDAVMKNCKIIRHKHKRFKIMLFIRTKHNMHIFGGNSLYEATK